MIDVKIVRLLPDISLPVYKTKGAAGFDLAAASDTLVHANGKVIVPTGLRMELPVGYELQIRPRSGVSLRSPILVAFGTVDSDYRGEIGVIAWNTSDENYLIGKGFRIAQGIIAPVVRAGFQEVEELSSTTRGEGGFGSTGVR